MLRVPDKRARQLLDLANLIENLPEDVEFNMRRWECCICGHYMRSQGLAGKVSDYFTAANMLGLSDDQARDLFAPTNDNGHVMLDTREDAAKRIRKLAFSFVD